MKVPIITYHSIDDSGSVVSVAPELFRRQVAFLSNSGYAALTLRELAALLSSGGPLPAKTVVLTFDDGFRNFYTEAFPVLTEFGFSATVFLVSDFCGGHNDWPGNPPRLPRSELLSWEEVGELHRHGIEFGSHTRTHVDLTRVAADIARAEIGVSKQVIADHLGAEPQTFAYPFGRFNNEVRDIAVENFAASCSTNLGFVTPQSDAAALKRLDAYYLSDRRFESLATSGFENYMRVRQALRQVRSSLAFR